MNQNTQTYSSHKQRGFTLMEAMIALVIFSIGLLGLAGLQSVGLRSNQTGYLRTVAMQQAYNMADSMRVNNAGVIAGLYDGMDSGVGTLPASASCAGIANSCTSAAIATSDYFEWQSINQATLPSGHGTVELLGNGNRAIKVFYDEAGTNPLGTVCPGGGANDLKCYILEVEY